MGAAGDPLAGLRDIHLPATVNWWPPAPGWWALAAALALGLALAVWLVLRWRRGRVRRAALRELRALETAYAEAGDAGAFAADLSRLLRRYALQRFPRREVAGLTGQDWLRFLDTTGGRGQFAEGPGRALTIAPYRPPQSLDVPALAGLGRRWIERATPIREAA